ncbi:hypothetical protein [uncultured Neptuniibacter sp.]|uniref:hypothetical protein n=1 Tax=uncultured Neptuniibacter sp. TaxID=502143 RepID=UPI00262C71B7|nr:hypothetical protein [uncultured Neptuniibacter sp.]
MIDTDDFLNAMDKIDTGFRELMGLLKEHDFPEVSNGVRHYYVDDGKLPFQEAQQFDRPDEFLQALLDVLRVQFEPWPIGTFFLNSNVMAYLADRVEQRSFSFSYASMTSEPQATFTGFWLTAVEPYLNKLGMPFNDGQSFVVVTVGQSNYTLSLVEEVDSVLGSGTSLASAMKAVVGARETEQRIVCGYAIEEGLGSGIRVSIWRMESGLS